jgi:hypothetical protein
VFQRQRGGRRLGVQPTDRWLWITLSRFCVRR